MISVEMTVDLGVAHLGVCWVVLGEDCVHEDVGGVVGGWFGAWDDCRETFSLERTLHVGFLQPVVLGVEHHMVMEMVHVVDMVVDHYTSLIADDTFTEFSHDLSLILLVLVLGHSSLLIDRNIPFMVNRIPHISLMSGLITN